MRQKHTPSSVEGGGQKKEKKQKLSKTLRNHSLLFNFAKDWYVVRSIFKRLGEGVLIHLLRSPDINFQIERRLFFCGLV